MTTATLRRSPLASGRRRAGDSEGPVESVTRGLAILSVAWQALTLAPDPANWPGAQASPVAAILLATSIVTWAALVATTWGPLRRLARARHAIAAANALVLLAAALSMTAAKPGLDADGWRPAATVFDLAVGLAGLALPLRVAAPILVAAIAADAVLIELHVLGGSLGGSDNLLYSLYAAAIAVASAGSRTALLIAARESEWAQAELLQAESDAVAAKEVQRRVQDQARLLHESVLNTLTAIARGVHDPGGLRLRAWCRQSIEVLESMRDIGMASRAPRDLRGVLQADIDDLRSAGIDVDVLDRMTGRPPAEAEHAMAGAVREALLNIARHSKATSVRMLADGPRPDGSWHITVTDDGRGFDPAAVPAGGYGIRNAIVRQLAEAGGTAEVRSTPGSGTVVELAWRPDDGRGDGTSLVGSSLVFVAPMLLSFGVFALASFLLTASQVQRRGLSLLALATCLAAGAIVMAAARRGPLSLRVVLAVAVASPVAYQLQVAAIGTSNGTMWAEWASEAVMALLFAVAAAGTWWAWLIALASWLVTQGDPLGELLQPGTAIILAGALFARAMRASQRESAAARDRQRRTHIEQAAEQDLARVLTRRYAALAASRAPALLGGILDGTLDAADPDVRERCAVEERFIRSVMRLDPSADALQAMAMRLAERAYRAGLLLSVDIDDGVPVSGRLATQLPRLEHAVSTVLPSLSQADPVRMSARLEGGAVVVRVVGQIRADAWPVAPDQSALRFVDESDGTVLWEVRGG